MIRNLLRLAVGFAALAAAVLLTACNSSSPAKSGTVHLVLSDASTDDWATIGVRVMGVVLVPQGGGAPVTVYTAPNPAPFVNLAQLDDLADLLGDVEVPAGTYTGAVVTIGANTGDVRLVVGADPEPGFPLDPGSQVPPGQIMIRGATGDTGHMTVSVNLRLESPLVVAEGDDKSLDLEFDLANPVFIVEHDPASGPPVWVVSFSGPLRHRPVPDLAHLVLRHLYGTVRAVAADHASITIDRFLPAVAPDPEPAVTTSQSLRILADATNGTLFWDLDGIAGPTTVHDFGSVAGTLAGKYVRIAARYQQNGTLVAVRIWASATFQKVWVSPEGHVLHVDAANHVLTVLGENGVGVPLNVDENTKFFFRGPVTALWDATPIGTGTAFLANLKRGFKVHATLDPAAVATTAAAVDIEIAKFGGAISAADTTRFHYSRIFANASDSYEVSPAYISSTTFNGRDASGNPIFGFKWWNFAFPTLADTGLGAITDYIAATSGSADFGGTVGPVVARGESFLRWNDPAAPNDWSARWTVLVPSRLPPGTVDTGWTSDGGGGSFGMIADGNAGGNAVTIEVSTVLGSATLVYRVDRTVTGGVAITPQDITNASVLANVSAALTSGTPVRVFGIPRTDGSIKAYVLFYFTPVMP